MIDSFYQILKSLLKFGKIYPYRPPVIGLGELEHTGILDISNLQKRALLSYITTPFRIAENDERLIQFSNIGMARCIVQVLIELGYLVDVVEWSDNKFLPYNHYDLFIGHGGINYERIFKKLPAKTIKIYYSTGLYWQTHNKNELSRFYDLERRRGVKLNPDRLIRASEEWANINADAIICLGNENARKSFSKFKNVLPINNASYHDDHFDNAIHNYNLKKKNFLFFAGGGNVHKGLDLLLEIFPKLKADLWICQSIDNEFYKVYRHELEDFSNIHNIGWIPMRSKKFYEIVDRCGYIIFPSCSEGQPGSVIECMNQGLIPIISKECVINIEDFGIQLNSCTIQEIENCIINLLEKPIQWIKETSFRSRKAAIENYSTDYFKKNFKISVETIISTKRKLNNK